MAKHNYTQKEREELCKEYESGNQSRKSFCREHDISTKSLSRWLNASKAKAEKFVAIGELRAASDILTEIALPGGINIRLQLDAAKLSCLIKDLL